MVRNVISGLAIVLCAAFCGCRTSYKEALMARNDVMFGSGDFAIKRATEMANSTVNRKLGAFELARLKMLRGDFHGSSSVFAPRLEEMFDETNEGPILKKGQIAGNILAGTVGDDRAIPYELPAFELIFGLQYQAVNSLILGDTGNARAYLRRATAVQEQLKEEKTDPYADGGEEVSAENAQNASKAAGEITAKLSPVADLVRSSYENAFAWYLMGLFFTNENDPSNADIAYREAGRINPAIAQFTRPAPGAGQDVIVVYEDDLVDQQAPVKIPLPFGGTLWSVDFPIYNEPAHIPSTITVERGGAMVATCVPVVNVQALAYRHLRDRIPGVTTRNVTRAAVKIAAQQVANHVDTGNAYANLAIMLGVFAFNAASTVISEADTRGWQTLPEHVQLARIRLPPDAQSIVLRNARTGLACEVALPAGGAGPRFVWFTDARGFATVSVFPLLGGFQPTWTRVQSLIGGRPEFHP